jgi:hypothetical protein
MNNAATTITTCKEVPLVGLTLPEGAVLTVRRILRHTDPYTRTQAGGLTILARDESDTLVTVHLTDLTPADRAVVLAMPATHK